MFGFGISRITYPTVYTVGQRKKSSSKAPPSPARTEPPLSPESFQPAIEGPPSPERIRAYTEQMKRSSVFGNNSRTNTFSSATSSFRSRESTSVSTDNISLSRRSSGRSNASSMPSRTERPESVQIFGKPFFSRGGKKSRRENAGVVSAPSPVTLGDGAGGEAPARHSDRGNHSVRGTVNSPPPLTHENRRRHLISGPYNFQHVTHTGKDHLPNLERTSRTDLASEFSAIRAAQTPTNGELKGIKADNLHFENFSSEELSLSSEESSLRSPRSPRRQRSLLRKSTNPPEQFRRPLNYARSVDNLRSSPPQPPRSPLSPDCPLELPARTSSRTASILFDTFDPLATTTIERPRINGGFRRPMPFGIAAPPPPLVPTWNEAFDHDPDSQMTHAVTTPGDEAWPLTSSSTGNFGAELPDVQEEEEDSYIGSRRSRISTASGDLRLSQSVPILRQRSCDQAFERPETATSSTLGRTASKYTTVPDGFPLAAGIQLGEQSSWEDDIDYCYEHEVEADCDYQWDRCSTDEGTAVEEVPSTHNEPVLDLHLENDHKSDYRGRFKPSPVIPSLEPPELSPMSNTSTISSNPCTPSAFSRPTQIRSSSQASSFKESHGFNLSPTLLIPGDFSAQMEQDTIYDDHFKNHTTSATIFPQEQYSHPISPIDESISSTASYRSSNFSRGSARSSSSTRISGTNSRGSQDSVVLISRAASVSQAHRSIGSASSLPDLIPSTIRKAETTPSADLISQIAMLKILDVKEDEEDPPTGEAVPAPEINGAVFASSTTLLRRSKGLVLEQGLRKGVNHFAPPTGLQEDGADGNGNLSPVAETFDSPGYPNNRGSVHGRNASTPTLVSPAREFKSRARAATSASIGASAKRRGSYMLFPQI